MLLILYNHKQCVVHKMKSRTYTEEWLYKCTAGHILIFRWQLRFKRFHQISQHLVCFVF